MPHISDNAFCCMSPDTVHNILLTLGAHAHEGYITVLCLFVCLSVTSLLVPFHAYMTN